jgi:hypothetical protein
MWIIKKDITIKVLEMDLFGRESFRGVPESGSGMV